MGLIYDKHTMLALGDCCSQPSDDALNPACVIAKMNSNFPNDLILKIKKKKK